MAPRPLSPVAASAAIAYGVRSGDSDPLQYAAEVMAASLPADPVYVPLPDRTGNTATSLMLAQAMAKSGGGQVMDILQGMKPPRGLPLGLLSGDALRVRARGQLPEGLPEDTVLVDACDLPDSVHQSARAAIGRPDALSASWGRLGEIGDKTELLRAAERYLDGLGRRVAALIVPADNEAEGLRRQASLTPVTDDNGLRGSIDSGDIRLEDRVRLRKAVAMTLDGERLVATAGAVGDVIGRNGDQLVVVLPVELRRATASGNARESRTRMQACRVSANAVEVLLSSFDPRAKGLDRYRASPWT